MNAAYEKLIEHLDARDVRYLSNSDTGSVFTNFRGDAGTYRIVAVIDTQADLFQVFGYLPVLVPSGSRRSIAEAIARGNYGLRLGKFELDFDDGELRFQIASVLTEDRLEDEVIGRLLGTTLAMLDMYLPAFLSVIYGNELPEDAIALVEKGRQDTPDADGHESDPLD